MIGDGWTLTFEGRAWCESDLTIADLSRVLEVSGGDWRGFHPLRSPDDFAATLAVFLSFTGESFERALVRAAALHMTAAFHMVAEGEPGPLATPPQQIEEQPPPHGDPSGVREPRHPAPNAPAGSVAATV